MKQNTKTKSVKKIEKKKGWVQASKLKRKKLVTAFNESQKTAAAAAPMEELEQVMDEEEEEEKVEEEREKVEEEKEAPLSEF